MLKSVTRLAGATALCALALAPAGFAQEQAQYTTFEKYGFCGSIDDTCYNSWFDRTSGEEEPWKVFIYSHVATGVNPHDNRDAGVEALQGLLEEQGYEVTTSQDPADLESGFALRPYDAIVFFNTGRDAVTSLGMMALRIYVEGGGGFVGIHNAFGTNFNSTWFEGLLGAQLFDHGPRQTGTVVVESENDVSVAHMDEGTTFDDEEFYNVHPDPRWLSDVRILLSVDNSTREQGLEGYYGHPGMGDTNPVSWCHYYDGGRAWLTTLGHSFEVLENEDWRQHVLGGIDSAMGKEPFCQQ